MQALVQQSVAGRRGRAAHANRAGVRIDAANPWEGTDLASI